MEYIKGMEMFDIMREMGIMKNDVVRYYFGCLMSSVEYLHDKNIVYRDLKP
jgi:cGMP-dependent protein kinase